MVIFNTSSFGHFKLTSFQSTLKSIVSTKALTGLARRIKDHKEMQKLYRLDDHMLKDIGLYRSDLDWAMQQSQRIAPLVALQERRQETQHGEHLATVKAYCKANRN